MSIIIYSESDLKHGLDEVLSTLSGRFPSSVIQVVCAVDTLKRVSEGVRPTDIGVKHVVNTNSTNAQIALDTIKDTILVLTEDLHLVVEIIAGSTNYGVVVPAIVPIR